MPGGLTASRYPLAGFEHTGKFRMSNTEKFTVSGSQLVEKVKQLIREGNIRKVRLLHEGRVLIEIPLSIGAPAAALGILAAPVWRQLVPLPP